MGRLTIYLILSYFIFSYIVRTTLEEQGPEIAKAILNMDQKHLQQLQSVDKRIEKTASQKVAKDLMEQGPLAPVLGVLTEETRSYLGEHPEALPGVLQSYSGTIDVVLKMLPQLQEAIPGLSQLMKKPGQQLPYDY